MPQIAVVSRLLAAMFLMLVCFTGCRQNGSAVVIHGTEAETATEHAAVTAVPETMLEETSAKSEVGGATSMEETTLAMIYVHICGQVHQPGVYALEEGCRVWDAVEAAGGFTERAAPEAVNLAMSVADGSKVTIPTGEEAQDGTFHWYETGSGVGASVGDTGAQTGTSAGGMSAGSSLVDINRADVNQLMTIPGIGQVRAEAIVDHRENHGSFGTIEEIMQVTGIKEGLFEKIRDYITVGG